MDSAKRLFLSIGFVIVICLLGSAGYMVLEGWSAVDALYMTVMTLATVGYGEVHELDYVGKVYTMLLIVFGVGFFLYVIGAVVQFMVEGRIKTLLGRKRLDRQIGHLKNHYIVCGYGRIGKVLCENLKRRPIDLVVIDSDLELAVNMDEKALFLVSGDATDESVLLKAGIKSAKGLIAVLGTDADNVFLVLTARQLNPELFIMARAGYPGTRPKLKAAGADVVESPYEMGAISMAQRIIRPTVTSFLDLAVTDQSKEIQMEEIPIGAGSELAGVTLQDSGIRQKYNMIIIAVKKPDGSMLYNPSYETVLNVGDTVIAVGEAYNLQQLEKILDV